MFSCRYVTYNTYVCQVYSPKFGRQVFLGSPRQANPDCFNMKKFVVPIALMLASAASLFLGFTVLRSAFAGFVLYYLLCCVALPLLDILVLRKIPARSVPELVGLSSPRKKDIALGVGAGLAMAAAMLVALVAFKGGVFGDGRIGAVLKGWGARGRTRWWSMS